MDVAKQIEDAIEELKAQKASLEEKIQVDDHERVELEQYMKEVQEKLEALRLSIEDSNKRLDDLVNTITETENGYGKLVTAGKTLMEIVSKNMDKLQPEKN